MYPNEYTAQNLSYGGQVTILYTNYKNETRYRTIKPVLIWWGSTEYHPIDQWLLKAWEYDKQDYREFAMKDIKEWREIPTNLFH